MPLSEDDERILRQIEEQLKRDPGFGRTLHQVRHGNRRGLVVSSIAAVVGLALTIALLAVSPYLSFVAFLGAALAALYAERQARILGEAGLQQISDSVRGRFGPRTRADD